MNLAFVSRFGTKKDCACVSSASTVIMFQMKTAWRQDLSCILVCVFCASVTYGMSVDFSRLRKPYLLPKRADSCKFQVLLFSLCLLCPFLQFLVHQLNSIYCSRTNKSTVSCSFSIFQTTFFYQQHFFREQYCKFRETKENDVNVFHCQTCKCTF